MDFFDELNRVINTNFDDFQEFIARKKASNKDLLQETIWNQDGKQSTLLNYLILAHDAEKNNLSQHIEYIIHEGADISSSQPIHLALKLKKIDLFFILCSVINHLKALLGYKSNPAGENSCLEDEIQRAPEAAMTLQFDLNARDEEGQTLIARAIQTKDTNVLKEVLAWKPNVNQASKGLPPLQPLEDLQPLHLAVCLDFPDAVHALIKANAAINNPCLKQKQTPLLMSADLVTEKTLEALLQYVIVKPDEPNPLDTSVNIDNLPAIDLLCNRLQNKEAPVRSIRCIAMLLCHGASAPRSDEFRNLLRDNNMALLNAVSEYTKDKTQLGLQFARAVYNKDNPLHDIIFADRALSTSARHFFGIVRGIGYKLADLVLRASATANEISLARFVKSYQKGISEECFYNRNSTMLWRIERGNLSWDEVKNYVQSYPNKRSAKIFDDMNKVGAKVEMHNVLNSSEQDEDEAENGASRSLS
ncbi:MAG: hypothetical protein Q8M03_06075 [Legionella sp.]|nr:hypothetical protein [Legionella sp.]